MSDLSQEEAKRQKLIWSSLTGAAAALAAFGLSAIILRNTGAGWQILILTSPLAAFLTGFGLWWGFMTLRRKVTVLYGAGVGILISILSHPLAWYLTILWNYFAGETSSLDGPTANPIEGLWFSLILSLGSLLLVGWITIPAGGLGGGIIAYWQSRYYS